MNRRGAGARTSLAGRLGWELGEDSGNSKPIQSALQRLIAVGYGLTYDVVVGGFRPYQALLDEIATLIARSRPAADSLASTKILDVACGTGTVAIRLAREGYSVVGLDAVPHLVAVARQRSRRQSGPNLTFHHLDPARDPVPGEGTFDVLVSVHTLYWHPNPHGLLESCHRALKPGGYGIFLTYSRPAHVFEMFREIRAREGIGQALRALRWLVPTAVFELFRHHNQHYLSQEEFHGALARAGFELIESRQTFLAQISLLAWARTHGAFARA